MPDDARLGVAVDVGLPLPARRVRVARPDVFGLEALELLLRAQLVGLSVAGREMGVVSNFVNGKAFQWERRRVGGGGGGVWGQTYHLGWVARRVGG